MNTIEIQNKKYKTKYKTNAGMCMQCSSVDNEVNGLFGANIYTIKEKPDLILLVAYNGRNGGEVVSSKTIITKKDYEKICDNWEVYNEQPFYWAVMSKLGFS